VLKKSLMLTGNLNMKTKALKSVTENLQIKLAEKRLHLKNAHNKYYYRQVIESVANIATPELPRKYFTTELSVPGDFR
jgi:hypothetical protein